MYTKIAGKLCIWCGKPISLCSNAENGFGTEFCSEICFDQFRRDSFKKRSACIWCNNNSKGNRTAINNNNNNSENGLSFSTSPLDETKFCSENCLAQFKVRLFCEETSAHLDQLKVNLYYICLAFFVSFLIFCSIADCWVNFSGFNFNLLRIFGL